MRPGRTVALMVVVAFLGIGCAIMTKPGRSDFGWQVEATQGEAVSPQARGEKLAAGSASPTLEPTPEAEPSPTVAASSDEASPTAVAAPAELPATAEGPDQEASGTPRTTLPEAPAPPRPAPLLSLHPFRPAEGRARVVAIDPGHGGPEVGAGGAGLAEKNVNLDIALGLRLLLEEDGMKVVLTRERDSRAYVPSGNGASEGTSSTRQDIQARIDIANRAQADAFISIHNNGSGDPDQSGTEVWYDGKRPFAAFNAALADNVLSSLVEAIRGAGYPTLNRGVKEDSQFRIFQGRAFPIFILGPPRTGSSATRAGQMPTVLGETLFLSNPYEAWQLTREEMIAAIAGGYRQGLLRYFERIDSGALALPEEGLLPEKPNFYQLTPGPGPGG